MRTAGLVPVPDRELEGEQDEKRGHPPEHGMTRFHMEATMAVPSDGQRYPIEDKSHDRAPRN